ncbi:hypothetical protein XBJ1_3635 [Xenorhabdus bovienii SS-2004]|uniref:Uncharacterized protein n=1 Tax=Xenorhabdus bovienii (strain SS-2004) TaxID=406818 RepID=D3V524_XENBS|nr:hypothetical protein XBJ1_3635 [Xenorhabdus bovienii SS-2004]
MRLLALLTPFNIFFKIHRMRDRIIEYYLNIHSRMYSRYYSYYSWINDDIRINKINHIIDI